MILTLYYMYATFVQWWRLGVLRQRLGGTLNAQNALLLTSSTSCIGGDGIVKDGEGDGGKAGHTRTASGSIPGRRSLESLLYQHEGRIACTIVPRQKLHLGQWAAFPKDRRSFPVHYRCSALMRHKCGGSSLKVHLLLQASLDKDVPPKTDFIQMEAFGELLAWRARDFFEVILKSDLEKVTVLMNSFRFYSMGINHDLPLIKVEIVDVDGTPGKIKYDRRPSKLKYSHGPAQIQEFAACLRQLYSRVSENFNPKIMIENGTTRKSHEREKDKKPVSEVKPIKKSTKNTLDVHHSSSHKKREKTTSHKEHKDHAKSTSAKNKDVKAVTDTKEVKQSKVISQQTHATKENSSDVRLDAQTADLSVKKADEVRTSNGQRELNVQEAKEYEDVKESQSQVKPPSKMYKTRDKDVTALKHDRKTEEEKSKVHHPLQSTQSLVIASKKDSLTVAKKSYSDVTATPSKTSLQRQNATSSNSKETSPNRTTKPPNILVYADTPLTRANVKSVLKTIINQDKYTVYDFPSSLAKNGEFWNASTTLVIVCGNVPTPLTQQLLGYLVNGGQLLCLCSDLLYSVLQPFSTAEVREHELVRFTYGEWKRVKMMHHIFCYQASPAKKQFSREASDQSMNGGSTGSSPVAPRTPSIVDIQHEGKRFTIQVQVLGAEETWQTPSLLLASVRGGAGKAVFSQVHLEVDPTQYQDDESKFAALKDSNQARLEIMKHILSQHLEIDCPKVAGVVDYGPGYFLGRHDLKMELINGSAINCGKLQLPQLQLHFLTTNVNPPPASQDLLPILVLRCPTNFSTVEYFDTLTSARIGRLVIYADVLTSSQHVLASKLTDGLVVIAKRQTQGKGRGGNDWLSPAGCAMFSIQLHIPLDSHLGRSIPLVQHLVMVAVAAGVKKCTGLPNLEVGLKWPNDLYAYGNIKIGGLVAASIIEQEVAVVNVGCGINLDNREPTICINDMIKDLDQTKSTLSLEKFLAVAFNEAERLIDQTQENGVDWLLEEYYKHWLHSNANITVATSDGITKKVSIQGVDSYGFLQVVNEAGVVSTVQADGNTFDMLRGLIAPKLTS